MEELQGQATERLQHVLRAMQPLPAHRRARLGVQPEHHHGHRGGELRSRQ